MATAVADGARLPLIVSRLLVAAMLAAGCGVVASGSGSVTVPMQMLNTMTLVSVQVNGSPYHALFLLDTGANLTVLNPLYAGRLGIVVPDNARKKTIRAVGGAALTIPLVKVPRLAVGDAAVENMEIGVYDAFPQSRTIDGILGADFLNRFNVTLDRTNNRLRLDRIAR
ncbi:MAG: hypothetical protein DMD91_25185 [Candidatus Rokuibacteriota bacterium]|nr:MAG: hypothetical protein DMD91_25185 [Candidatus Rokubacteria bacterium]